MLLRGGAGESLTVKGAYFEVIADSLGSVGVMAAGVLVLTTGQGWWDTAVALAIALFVAVRAAMLGREVLAVLGQHAPAGVDPDAVAADLRVDAGRVGVHDLHLWTLTSGMHVATAHLVAEPGTATQVLAGAAHVAARAPRHRPRHRPGRDGCPVLPGAVLVAHELSREQARRIAVRAQLLDARRPTDVLATIRHLGFLQVDLTTVVAQHADLALWTRVGSPYRPEQLEELVGDGAVVELRAMLRPS